MKRVVASLAVIAAGLLALGGVAAAAGPKHTPAGPKRDLVAGTGQGSFPGSFGTFSSQVHVNAIGGPTHAHGSLWGRFFNTPIGTVRIRNSVVCVNAVGNQAIIGVIVRRSNTNFVPVGSTALWKIIDNGQGSNSPPDEAGSMVTGAPPVSCPPPSVTPIATGPVSRGNFVVKGGA